MRTIVLLTGFDGANHRSVQGKLPYSSIMCTCWLLYTDYYIK